MDERIEDLHWFSHVERMENDRITKSLYAGEFADAQWASHKRKRWIDTVMECKKKKIFIVGLNYVQA